MLLALPSFQFRFMAAMGNVIFPANFHPVGTQRAAEAMVDRALEARRFKAPGEGGRWLIVGASGGFGSAARVALGAVHGAHTLNVSLDAPPQPESKNKIRKIGSPGFHRNLAIERRLRALDLRALSLNADAFDPATLAATIGAIKGELGGPLDGIVWALAAPRATDPRSGQTIASALRPLGRAVSIKTFGGKEKDAPPRVMDFVIEPGSPEEAVATQYVMGGGIVDTWTRALLAAGALAPGFRLLTISYRGNPLNEGIYRKGLIGLAKADLEFHTRALDALLTRELGGRALAVEGPAVVTEASGGIPGVPFYMALLMDVMGDRFEDPLASMIRMFEGKVPVGGGELALDDEGLVRMDDRELGAEILDEVTRRFEAYAIGDAFDERLYDSFITEYARTRGFEVPGVDYSAEFDTDVICGIEASSAS